MHSLKTFVCWMLICIILNNVLLCRDYIYFLVSSYFFFKTSNDPINLTRLDRERTEPNWSHSGWFSSIHLNDWFGSGFKNRKPINVGSVRFCYRTDPTQLMHTPMKTTIYRNHKANENRYKKQRQEDTDIRGSENRTDVLGEPHPITILKNT